VDPPADFEPISRAKVTPALVRPETLHRGRLVDWLTGHAGRRLSLVVADAGYGKTTLLADYAQRADTRCLWLKLDHTDGDWVTFINYLVAAYGEAVPGFGHLTRQLMATTTTIRPSREMVVGTLMSELAKLTDERMILILDDYHLVDEAPDVRSIMGRLLRDAPPTMTYVLVTRRRPDLPIGRLSVSGEVVELGTDDLRFSRDEIRRLFAESYGQPLEEDVLDEVDRRTLGWAACLQLLRSTLRGRSNIEVREFVQQLSGATGPLYDFLAEEVLREATPEMRRFLIGTSLLESIVPGHVAALFAADDPPPDDKILRSRIQEAYETGLVGRGDPAAGSFRFHPLLREFLSRQLVLSTSADDVREMHLRIAGAAEHDAWLASCRHYIAAGREREAARVLVRSVLVAVGTGTWGEAAEVVSQLAGHSHEPEIEVILALKEVEDGRVSEALDRLEGVDEVLASPDARALLRFGRYRASWWSNNLGDAVQALRELRTDPETPGIIRDVAESHLMLFGDGTVNLAKASGVLSQAAAAQTSGGLHFFAGITQHNAMAVALARGRAQEALAWGNEALVHLREAGSAPHGIHATHAMLANCFGELGHSREAAESITLALSEGPEDLDAYAEAAYYLAVTGSVERAEAICRRADDIERSAPTDRMQRTGLAIARARTNIASGRALAAETELGTLEPAGIAARSTVLYLRALSAMAVDQSHVAIALAVAGLQSSQAEGSIRWRGRLRIIHAAAALDGRELAAAIREARRYGLLGLVDCAEAIVAALHLLVPIPEEVHDSIAKFPAAWLPPLRRKLGRGLSPEGVASAKLIDEHGEPMDVQRLRAYERTYLPGARAIGLGRRLSRRTAPQLRVHDLGAGWFEVGERQVRLTSIRRRAATVLGYLLTRPRATATREQILDSMWPDIDPDAALNSLNQTLYFLRRDIETGYDDDLSVNYVRLEGELIWLDLDLTASDSAMFAEGATSAVASGATRLDRTLKSVRAYSGRFLPEFEYEEWAIGWRERLHGSFLHLVNIAQLELVRLHRHSEAIDVTHYALSIDASNPALERALVWLYSSVGASTAASEQYQHYASTFRNELGIEPPSMEELLGAGLLDLGDV
jgi:ATP/maltotriose-dependent transcriptional regulator MalT/DNA-binding SARP family transcriptional activator